MIHRKKKLLDYQVDFCLVIKFEGCLAGWAVPGSNFPHCCCQKIYCCTFPSQVINRNSQRNAAVFLLSRIRTKLAGVLPLLVRHLTLTVWELHKGCSQIGVLIWYNHALVSIIGDISAAGPCSVTSTQHPSQFGTISKMHSNRQEKASQRSQLKCMHTFRTYLRVSLNMTGELLLNQSPLPVMS